MSAQERFAAWVDQWVSLPLAGLDISERSIRYAEFTPTGRGSSRLALSCIGEEDVPAGVIVDGSVQDHAALVTALRHAGDKAGYAFRTSGIVASLPEEKSFLRIFQVPKSAQSELAGAIRWKIEEEIPLPSAEIAYDYEPIELAAEEPDHADAVVTAFPKSVISSYTGAIKDAGLIPAVLELESQAIVRAVAPDIRSRDAYIVVDMQRGRTSIILFAGSTIIFTATVPVGTDTLDRAMADALKIKPEEASEIRMRGVLQDTHDGVLMDTYQAAFEGLFGETQRVISYYRDHAPHIHGGSNLIRTILLSGAAASIAGLDTYAARSLRTPVAYVDPFIGLPPKARGLLPPLPRGEALAYVTVLGLALRGIRDHRVKR